MNKETLFQQRLKLKEKQFGLTTQDIEGLSREEIYKRIAQSIGHTRISIIQLENDNLLIQKHESDNPTESHYDRVYGPLLYSLEKQGKIILGDFLLETTSGNAGISFAWIAGKLGYQTAVFMPDRLMTTEPRIVELQHLTDLHLIQSGDTFLKACAEAMMEYRKQLRQIDPNKRIWSPNHSQNDTTTQALTSMIEEVNKQIPKAGLKQIDFFIAGIGNGSTIYGPGQRLKNLYPNTQVIGFEPFNACPYFRQYKGKWGTIAPNLTRDQVTSNLYSGHQLLGTGSFGNIHFPFVQKAITEGIIDDICVVNEGPLLPELQTQYNEPLPLEKRQGNTSLIARYIAEKMAKTIREKVFLTLVYDRADRYGEVQYTK
ncbi:MAG: pyridoxal-phosphate dependent enzyme [Candidatus Gastranaerophilaceae bacterium]|jgi:cysteine synthase